MQKLREELLRKIQSRAHGRQLRPELIAEAKALAQSSTRHVEVAKIQAGIEQAPTRASAKNLEKAFRQKLVNKSLRDVAVYVVKQVETTAQLTNDSANTIRRRVDTWCRRINRIKEI